MPFCGNDFYASEHVMLMTWEERGIYQALLWHAWNHDGSLPNSVESLAKIVQVSSRKFARLWKKIAACWTEKDGRLHNERLTQEYEARMAYVDEQRRKSRIAHSHPGSPAGTPADVPADRPPFPSLPFPSQVPEGIPPTPHANGTPSTGGETSGSLGKGDRRDSEGASGDYAEAKTMDQVLLASPYRSHSRLSARNTAIFRAVLRFQRQNGTLANLRELVDRSGKGKDPGALLAFWLDKDEWQKELGKR